MKESNPLEVIIIGGGHAGLSASYYLRQHGISHAILERGQVGESWFSQRWDSFRLNTASKLNTLPGLDCGESEKHAFSSAQSLVSSMQDFVKINKLPVRQNVLVRQVEKDLSNDDFVVTALENGAICTFRCKQVIVASGSQSQKKVPPLSSGIKTGIRQLHSSEYRSPSALPEGGVLVIGSGQSGCQICEDLINAGRKVYLSTSKVPRCRRHYRGRDIMDWLILSGFFEIRAEQLPDPAMRNLRTPLLKGTDGGRASLSLQALARKGVQLFGRLENVSGNVVTFGDDAQTNLRFGDEFSERVKGMIDGFIKENNIHAPAATLDVDDEPVKPEEILKNETSVDLKDYHISSIIWATGFTSDFSYLKIPVLDASGVPIHLDGVSAVEGVYFLGLHWQRSRKSDILFGLKDDARFITDKIYNKLKSKLAPTAEPGPRIRGTMC
ncbi:NAD(P)/FAD-dependent oxidoreductase [Dyadobacter sp. CY107]|uniref:flavin-containing monooxygenase n=1 Tax=Dyadobacter fanqingshengii TaxID=2906443 RepID=UPI001F260391|nr:NAD(P)/FAD-dependent oxidoreductase [Dyadobacter fanqingshengii]MCF2502087.1 NAD(P)/FAD-dependent oxidoreductase [Dyadobacter fanqingshengii]